MVLVINSMMRAVDRSGNDGMCFDRMCFGRIQVLLQEVLQWVVL